jgi:hypothetical protein
MQRLVGKPHDDARSRRMAAGLMPPSIGIDQRQGAGSDQPFERLRDQHCRHPQALSFLKNE